MSAPQLQDDPTQSPWAAYMQPQVKSRFFLAWWVVLPAIPLAVVQGMSGWPEATARTKEPAEAIGYIIGYVIGGLLIPTVVAWIAYRVADRSQVSGSVGFTIMCGLVILGLLKSNPALQKLLIPPAASALPASKSIGPSQNSFGAFRFDVPKG